MRSGGSRANRRFGTKSNTCPSCPTGNNGKATMKFRGKGRARLERHLFEVHGKGRREIKRKDQQ